MQTDTPATGADDPLLPQAIAWIERLRGRGEDILPYPVSRLQREFTTGYSRAQALVDARVQRGEWSIAFAEDGTRYARILRRNTC